MHVIRIQQGLPKMRRIDVAFCRNKTLPDQGTVEGERDEFVLTSFLVHGRPLTLITSNGGVFHDWRNRYSRILWPAHVPCVPGHYRPPHSGADSGASGRLFSDMPLLATFPHVYMPNVANYLKMFFPVFLLGAVFGKIMDDSGSAKAIAHAIANKLGSIPILAVSSPVRF